MTADELRRHIIELLPPIFRSETIGGEPLASTLTDEMIVTALADRLRRQDEGAELLADVAANLEKRAEKAEAENERLRAEADALHEWGHECERIGKAYAAENERLRGENARLRALVTNPADVYPDAPRPDDDGKP